MCSTNILTVPKSLIVFDSIFLIQVLLRIWGRSFALTAVKQVTFSEILLEIGPKKNPFHFWDRSRFKKRLWYVPNFVPSFSLRLKLISSWVNLIKLLGAYLGA